MSLKLNPNNTWKLVEERLAQTKDAKHRRNLELVIEHMKREAEGDIEGVVATLSSKPKYLTHADTSIPEMNPQGDKDAVRKFYDLTIVQTGAHRLELATDRVIVDDFAVFTEGLMRIAYPGTTLKAMGVEVDDTEAYYLYETRMAVVWPVDPDDGMLTGEEVYNAGDGFAGIADRKITLGDVVDLETAA